MGRIERSFFKHIAIVFGVVAIVAISFIIYSYVNWSGYKDIHGKRINGVISEMIKSRGAIRCKLTGGDDQYIFGFAGNEKYRPSELYHFLSKGDSILKRADDDTLFVFKDRSKFYFILGETIY